MSGPTFIKKNSREHLRVALDEYMGHKLVSLRVMYDPGGGEPLRPGREGFAVNVTALPALITALI